MEQESEKQTNNSKIDRPWLYKKGQSGNPAGRPPGKTLKEYTREKLAAMTAEEREEFLNGLSKDVIWEMAEGKAASNVDVTSGGKPLPIFDYVSNRINNSDSQNQGTEEKN